MTFSPLTNQDRMEMQKCIGIKDAKELFCCVPDSCNIAGIQGLPPAISESEILTEMEALALKNQDTKDSLSLLGAGNYRHFIPSVVKHLAGRSEFYTAYTPYQAEMSQGMLQAIYEYQTLVCQLTGMDIANASLYDGATALAEAASLAVHFTERKEVLVSRSVHPHYREVLNTYGRAAEWEIKEVPFDIKTGLTDLDALGKMLSEKTAGVILQNPNFFGCIETITAEKIHAVGALLIVSADPFSLGILTPPGEYGADVVTGEGQSIGNAQNFGGPGLGLFAVKEKYSRFIPGRLVGQTEDSQGRRGFVLTLQAREQHIRREKAFSNICSNEALVALSSAIYLSAMGKQGLKQAATLTMKNAHALKASLEKKGLSPYFKTGGKATPFFQEVLMKTPSDPDEINRKLEEKGIIGGLSVSKYYPEIKNGWLVCANELMRSIDPAQVL
jgi:glycine dehydrogenase subunit 1